MHSARRRLGLRSCKPHRVRPAHQPVGHENRRRHGAMLPYGIRGGKPSILFFPERGAFGRDGGWLRARAGRSVRPLRENHRPCKASRPNRAPRNPRGDAAAAFRAPGRLRTHLRHPAHPGRRHRRQPVQYQPAYVLRRHRCRIDAGGPVSHTARELRNLVENEIDGVPAHRNRRPADPPRSHQRHRADRHGVGRASLRCRVRHRLHHAHEAHVRRPAPHRGKRLAAQKPRHGVGNRLGVLLLHRGGSVQRYGNASIVRGRHHAASHDSHVLGGF